MWTEFVSNLSINECKYVLLYFKMGQYIPKGRLRVSEYQAVVIDVFSKAIQQGKLTPGAILELLERKQSFFSKQALPPKQPEQKPKNPKTSNEVQRKPKKQESINVEHESLNNGQYTLTTVFGVNGDNVMKERNELITFAEKHNNEICQKNLVGTYTVRSLKRSDIVLILRTTNVIVGFVGLQVMTDNIFVEVICAISNQQLGQLLITKVKSLAQHRFHKKFVHLLALSNVIFFYRKQGFRNITLIDAQLQNEESKEVMSYITSLNEKFQELATKNNSQATEKEKNRLTLLASNEYGEFLGVLYQYENKSQIDDPAKLFRWDFDMVYVV